MLISIRMSIRSLFEINTLIISSTNIDNSEKFQLFY